MNRRHARRALLATAALLGLPALALIIALNADWNRARPWFDERISAALGRPFHIAGALSLSWEKAPLPARRWRDRLPWPRLIARDVHLANPPGMPAGDMASAGELSFALDPLALLERRIAIPVLRFDAPALRLRRAADGVNNWTFTPEQRASPWRLELERVVFSKGSVKLDDAFKHIELDADIDTLNADPDYGVAWAVRGKFNGEPLSGSGKAGAVLSLRHQDTPYPLMAELRVGGNRIAIEGTLTKPTELAALDLRLKVSGPSMARLYGLIGVVLPETPPYRSEGQLSGTLSAHASHWIYDRFTGQVGGSDIGGHLEYRSGRPRGRITGTVESRQLQLRDLAPLIGADSNASKRARGVAPVQPAGKLLPVEPFRTERWTSVDADVRFGAARIVRDGALPISALSTDLHLDQGVLRLAPLRFSVAGGDLDAALTLDGSARAGAPPIKAQLTLAARHLKLAQLLPAMQTLKASVGELNGDVRLAGSGESVAMLLGTANGDLRTVAEQGSISKLLLEEMGLNIGSVLLTKLTGDKQVKLNCMVADFDVRQGVMRSRSVVLDTEEALITVEGNVDLAQERLDLRIAPDARGLRVFSLRAPLYLRGPFSAPQVSVDKGVLALRAGGALALAALAAPAALLPLINAGPGADSMCGKLLAKARGAAPAPRR